MTVHALRIASAEYDDVTGELVFVLEGAPPSVPLPSGVRPDLAVVRSDRMRLGPVRVPRSPQPPTTCTWTDPATGERWRATWNAATSSWGEPSRLST